MKYRKIAFFFLILGKRYTRAGYKRTWYVKTIWARSRKEAYYRYFSAVFSGDTFADIEEYTPKYFKYLCCAETEEIDYIYTRGKKRALEKAMNTLKKRLTLSDKAHWNEYEYLINQWKGDEI